MQKTYAIKNTASYTHRGSREYVLMVRDLPSGDKPRERLMHQGPSALSTKELIAVVLCTGTKKEGLLEMSSRIIRDYGEKSLLSEKSAKKMAHEMRIPLIKACQIVAVGELGRRFYERTDSGATVIRSAKDVYVYLQEMGKLPKEHLRGLYLNAHYKIIRDEVISIGTINSSIFHPREVFRPAIECNAVAVVLAHNHPSGESVASREDIDITEQLIQAGHIIGIAVLDHVIIAKNTFTSVNVTY